MGKQYVAVLALTAGLAMAGCHGGTPTGQVAARVGNDEITVQELQAELAGYNAPDAKARKAAEQQALQAIIQRKLIAKAAAKAGVAKSPAFALQKARMEDILLVQSWQKTLVDAVPEPGPEQVRQYISQHPELFANRKVYIVDQLRMQAVSDPKLAAEMKPLNTLEDIAKLLQSKGIRYEQARGALDSLELGSQIVTQIDKLPAGEIFVLPTGNLLVANKIIETRVAPVPDAAAQKIAARSIKAQQAQDSVRRMFGSVVTNHPGTKVVYNQAYTPPPAPAKAPSTGQPATGGKAG
jgi:EpsD family peptidyl-prolyl cis-trans isomerase